MKKQPVFVDPEPTQTSQDQIPVLGESQPAQPAPEEPIGPPVNSLLNPEGHVVEPITSDSQPEPQQQPQAASQPTQTQPIQQAPTQPLKPAQPASQQTTPQTAAQEPSPTPTQKPDKSQAPEQALKSNRKFQSEQRYTSEMKKKKEQPGENQIEAKVENVADRSSNVLMRIKTVFPFDIFPDTITVDANKVTIVDKIFFASETVVSILLEEITDVVVESNAFLARMVITYSHHPLQPKKYAVTALKKKEALQMKEIIQGLLVLRISEGIDLSRLKPDEVTRELARIGATHENLTSL